MSKHTYHTGEIFKPVSSIVVCIYMKPFSLLYLHFSRESLLLFVEFQRKTRKPLMWKNILSFPICYKFTISKISTFVISNIIQSKGYFSFVSVSKFALSKQCVVFKSVRRNNLRLVETQQQIKFYVNSKLWNKLAQSKAIGNARHLINERRKPRSLSETHWCQHPRG